MINFIKTLTRGAMVLALIVVMIGAYTRLTHAGLGCPDWPGCYGHIIVQNTDLSANGVLAERPKAWTEMIHRYAAGTLATIILLLLMLSAWQRKYQPNFPIATPIVLTTLILFQAILGMWTVTLKLLPIVVMSHLLGGVLIFSLIGLFYLQQMPTTPSYNPVLHRACIIAVLIVLAQIALGGWVSANYAGVACVGFPQCNNQWIPEMHFAQGFNLFAPVGDNYQGGVLPNQVRATIQFIHRLGAVITLVYVSSLMLYLRKKVVLGLVPKLALVILVVVFLQFILGIINVVYLLPLVNAVLHNGMAALLLSTTLMLVYITRRPCHV